MLPVNPYDPEVIRVLRQHRLDLIAREDKQINRMANTWYQLEQSLHDEMALLALDIDQARAKGDIITEQLLRRMDRYQRLNNQMRKEIDKYVSDVAAPDIMSEQLNYGLAAIEASIDVLRFVGTPGARFDRLPKDAVETYVGYLGDGTPLTRLLKEAYPDALDGVVKAFLEGAAKGLNPIAIADNAARDMGAGLERLTLIARTEQLRVNRAVSAEQYRASGLDGFMRRVATKDTAVCMACLASDGEIIALDDELEDHPRGRCVAIFQPKGANIIQWEKGGTWFARQPEEVQREMMGDKKFELYKRGHIEIADFRKTNYDMVWGDTPREATLKELLDGRNYSSLVSQSSPEIIVAPAIQGIAPVDVNIDNDISPDIRINDTGDVKVKAAEGFHFEGAFDSERVTIVGNGDAIIKTDLTGTGRGGWGDYDITEGFAKREVMAYDLDQLLKLNVVPQTTPFIEDGKYKSMQLWIENAKMGKTVTDSDTVKDITSPGRLALLDAITGNQDRHGANWLLANGKVFAIDNGLAMTTEMQALGFESFLYRLNDVGNVGDFTQQSYLIGTRLLLPSKYKKALEKAIKDGSLREVLMRASIGNQKVDKALVDAAIKRSKKLIKEWDQYFYEK